jgi:hypothetical protein
MIGNVSTSEARLEKKLDFVYFEIFPRFPVLGGWGVEW